jgi:6-pyruvoyltetrahydropterin/6-carboxytetrahydropterin synthase
MRLTRRYRFSASHRLNTEALTAQENARLYGKCNNPFGHGHDYVLDVSVEGPLDASGQIVDRNALDALVAQQVLEHVDHRNLNCDLDELQNQVPTTENFAFAIEAMLLRKWTLPARLARVRISETARNTFELETK